MMETARVRLGRAWPKGLIRSCPNCRGGHINWCNISVRPYCAECHTWGRINYGTVADAVGQWNQAVIKYDMTQLRKLTERLGLISQDKVDD